MKKVLLVLGILLCLSSCEYENKEVKSVKENIDPYSAVKFTFEGHDYIHFNMYDFGYDRGSGYVHDPECRKCKNNK